MRPPGTKEQRRAFARWCGRRSYEARLERFGLAYLQKVARENGLRGGRPRNKKED